MASIKEEMDEEEMKAEITRLKAELKKRKMAEDPFGPCVDSTAPKARSTKQTTNKNKQ